jgi:hypothetical protein
MCEMIGMPWSQPQTRETMEALIFALIARVMGTRSMRRLPSFGCGAVSGWRDAPQQYERHLAKRVRSGLFESQARVWQGPAHQVQTSRICPRRESLGEFWSFSKAKRGTYQARREYIWDSLRSLLEYLKAEDRSPGVEPISEILAGGWVSPCSRSVSPQGF